MTCRFNKTSWLTLLLCYIMDPVRGSFLSDVVLGRWCSAITVKIDLVIINERIRVIEELGITIKKVMSIDFILQDIKVRIHFVT